MYLILCVAEFYKRVSAIFVNFAEGKCVRLYEIVSEKEKATLCGSMLTHANSHTPRTNNNKKVDDDDDNDDNDE